MLVGHFLLGAVIGAVLVAVGWASGWSWPWLLGLYVVGGNFGTLASILVALVLRRKRRVRPKAAGQIGAARRVGPEG